MLWYVVVATEGLTAGGGLVKIYVWFFSMTFFDVMTSVDENTFLLNFKFISVNFKKYSYLHIPC